MLPVSVMTLASTFHVAPLSHELDAALQARIDNKTKPLGALGRLEGLALQLGRIQHTLNPRLARPAILVFAADHGVVEEGVSAFPQAVTYQMVLNFLAGGAAINVFARQNGFALRVVDAGVKGAFAAHPKLIDAKVAPGTANFLHAPAMSEAQCLQALERGRQLARAETEAGSNVLGFGEMGIGNTTSAAALMSVLCELPVEECSGRGTGLDDAALVHKCAVITTALQRHALRRDEPLRVLAALGGLEIAMMAGAMLGAAEQRALLLIDGFIATSALLVAARLQPAILDYCVFSHQSDESGHARLLQQLGAKPLLDLGMRLGEGTGAAVVFPLLMAAANFLNEMASFESAGVSESAGA